MGATTASRDVALQIMEASEGNSASIPRKTAKLACAYLDRLRLVMEGNLDPPRVVFDDFGKVILSWRRDCRGLSLEVQGIRVEFYYRDTETEEDYLVSFHGIYPVPDVFLNRLQLFTIQTGEPEKTIYKSRPDDCDDRGRVSKSLIVACSGKNKSISPADAGRAWIVLCELFEVAPGPMDWPNVAFGAGGEVFFSWNPGRHYFEVEVIPGEPIGYTYRDRKCPQCRLEFCWSPAKLSYKMRDMLGYFVKSNFKQAPEPVPTEDMSIDELKSTTEALKAAYADLQSGIQATRS